MKVKPISNNVLIKRLEKEETTKGGIVLPETAKEKPTKGKVLAVGNGKLLDDGTRTSFQVKVGDLVLFNSYGGNDVEIDGEEVLIMEESDIMAILEN